MNNREYREEGCTLNFKELKKNSKKSLKKNYIITVLVAITGIFLLSMYSITSSVISYGIESLSNLFNYGVFLPNTYYDWLKEYEKTNDIESIDVEELEQKEQERTLAERYRVTDGLFKPILDFVDNEWQFLYDNIANMFRKVLPQDYRKY